MKAIVSQPRTVTYVEGDEPGEVYFQTPGGCHIRPYDTAEQRQHILEDIADTLAAQNYELVCTSRDLNTTGGKPLRQITRLYCAS